MSEGNLQISLECVDKVSAELERLGFERWASHSLSESERRGVLARYPNGDYVLATMRAAWAAWRGRGALEAMMEGIP